MKTYTGMLQWQTGALCTSGGDSGDAAHPRVGARAYPGSPAGSEVTCDIGSIGPTGVVIRGYLDRALAPPGGLDVVICTATTKLDFSHTPLAWGVFWTPTVHAQSEALPPPFRQ